jgi:orotate phosphoribosyltransferase
MPLSQAEVTKVLGETGAVITGSHLVYTSGRHGECYVNKDAIYPHTRLISQLCRSLAETFAASNVEIVLGPALGGIILSQWVAHHLSDIYGREILGVYAEKSTEGDGFVIKRGYDKLIKGKRTLVVEDVLTTGGSVKKVIETATTIGATIVGVAALCNRGGLSKEMLGDIPKLHALLEISLDSWAEENCPLCEKNIPINTAVGKGADFVARRK